MGAVSRMFNSHKHCVSNIYYRDSIFKLLRFYQIQKKLNDEYYEPLLKEKNEEILRLKYQISALLYGAA